MLSEEDDEEDDETVLQPTNQSLSTREKPRNEGRGRRDGPSTSSTTTRAAGSPEPSPQLDVVQKESPTFTETLIVAEKIVDTISVQAPATPARTPAKKEDPPARPPIGERTPFFGRRRRKKKDAQQAAEQEQAAVAAAASYAEGSPPTPVTPKRSSSRLSISVEGNARASPLLPVEPTDSPVRRESVAPRNLALMFPDGSPGALGSDAIISIYVRRCDTLKSDVKISHPLVRVSLVDLKTGQYLRKTDPSRQAVTQYENEEGGKPFEYILPVLTKPFDLHGRDGTVCKWDEELIIDEDYLRTLDYNHMLFFELVDFGGDLNLHKYSDGMYNIAWAFLRLVSYSGRANTEREVRLQLFQHGPRPSRSASSSADMKTPQAYVSWAAAYEGRWQRSLYLSTLYVTIRGVPRPDKRIVQGKRPSNARETEVGRKTVEELMIDRLEASASETQAPRTEAQLTEEYKLRQARQRPPGQLCRLPNVIMNRLEAGEAGGFSICFSHDGRFLAAGCAEKGMSLFPLRVYSVDTGKFRSLQGHHNLVYGLCWSDDDTELLSASSDTTAKIWSVNALAAPVAFATSAPTSPIHDTASTAATAATAAAAAAYDDDDGKGTQQMHMPSSSSSMPTPRKTISPPRPSPSATPLLVERCIRTFPHPCYVYCAQFHPSAASPRLVLTGAYDHVIRLWDRDTGVLLRELLGHESHVNCLAFEKASGKFFSGDGDGVIKVWGWDPTLLPARKTASASRSPSPAATTDTRPQTLRTSDAPARTSQPEGQARQKQRSPSPSPSSSVPALQGDTDRLGVLRPDPRRPSPSPSPSPSPNSSPLPPEFMANLSYTHIRFLCNVEDKEGTGASITSLRVHPVRPRLLVQSWGALRRGAAPAMWGVRALDTRVLSFVQRYSGVLNVQQRVRSDYSPDGRFVISGSEDGAVYVWYAESGSLARPKWAWPSSVDDKESSSTSTSMSAGPVCVCDVAWHPTEHVVAMCAFGRRYPIFLFQHSPSAEEISEPLLPLSTIGLGGLGAFQSVVKAAQEKAMRDKERAHAVIGRWKSKRDITEEAEATVGVGIVNVLQSARPQSSVSSRQESDHIETRVSFAAPSQTDLLLSRQSLSTSAVADVPLTDPKARAQARLERLRAAKMRSVKAPEDVSLEPSVAEKGTE